MAKPRGLYTPVYASLPRHSKVEAASSALRCDRHKFVGHLVTFWTWCLGSAAGKGKPITAQAVALGAEWPPRKAAQFAEALADAGLLERVDGGYIVHEWAEYGGKVAEIQQRDRQRHSGGGSAEIPQNFPGYSSLDETRRDENETKEDEKKPEIQKPEARKRAPREHLPVDEPFIASLVVEFADVFSERKVRDTVERALNHVASRKWVDKRKGLRDWLKRDAADEAPRTPTPIRAASPTFTPGGVCGVEGCNHGNLRSSWLCMARSAE